ncbi:MAG: prolyl oligopeptidase family serine peptidase [Vicinamibacterales bacterium]
MRRVLTFALLFVIAPWWVTAQQRTATAPAPSPMSMLTVDGIMRGPKLVGGAPSAVRWSKDSSKIYFSWQKPDQDRAATYVVNRDGSGLRQLSADEARTLDTLPAGRFDRAHKRLLTVENGDVVVYDAGSGARRLLTRTAATETNARWARNDSAVTFTRDGNLFLMSLEASSAAPFEQLTDIVPADTPATAAAANAAGRGAGGGRGGGATGRGGATATATATDTESQRYLRDEERSLIDYIRRQAEGRQGGAGGAGRGGRAGGPGGGAPETPIAKLQLSPRQALADLQLSSDEKYVWIGVTERPEGTARNQDVPSYVTTSAYPEMISGRTNVGDAQARRLLAVLDLKSGTSTWADASAFAGIERKAKPTDPDVPRVLDWSAPDASDDGAQAIVAVRSQDNKDRWYAKVDPASGKATVLDQLHDEAWIREASIGGGGGGGFGGAGTGVAWLPDNKRVLFLSEKDGWMHLYSLDVTAASPRAVQLTSGRWEVSSAQLSADRKTVFLTTSEVHPGERHFYTMPVDGGARTRLTTMTGSNEATVSPDEKSLAIVYSYTIKPPELYVMPFAVGAQARQVTTTPTDEWRNFKWIDPKIITYKARDGAEVYARLFTPEMIGAKRDPKRPAVVFVHGAGYLQEAHKYWSSSYYRENMFNNILASKGYVVLDPDYRASAGYGRDWRTAIYRHMGGKDLEDVVDGARFLVATEKVDAKRIGVYGGSYGGFITLMAMFTTPDVFAAGAALRPVTDWAHYNHGYTSDILNVPQIDPDAYKISSPIYFADGLKGHLLICHGMVDTNVFFQDSVRLVQRLIELRKENWEIEPYPVENHSFTEETSWADEYKRILRVFEENLRR